MQRYHSVLHYSCNYQLHSLYTMSCISTSICITSHHMDNYGIYINFIMLSLIFVGLDLNKTQESRSSRALLIAAVSSSIVAFLVILTSATGVACGYYFMRRRRRKQSPSSSQPMEPLYEDVILNALPQPSAVEHQEQGLELKENVAYETTKPIDPLHHEALPSAAEHHLEQGLELTENVAYGTTKHVTHS